MDLSDCEVVWEGFQVHGLVCHFVETFLFISINHYLFFLVLLTVFFRDPDNKRLFILTQSFLFISLKFL